MSKKRAKTDETPDALLLTAHGTVQLLNADDEVLWSSDEDDDFVDQFNDEFLDEDDVEDIMEYLVDAEWIDEDTELDLRVDSLEESEDVDLRDTRDL